MVASAAVLEAGDGLLSGIPVITSLTHGRNSKLERLALRSRELGDTATGFAELIGLTLQELVVLYYEPSYSLRPVQQPPAHYQTFFFMGGRGTGKTHAGASAIIEEARADPEARLLIVGPTYSEIVKNQVEGPAS